MAETTTTGPKDKKPKWSIKPFDFTKVKKISDTPVVRTPQRKPDPVVVNDIEPTQQLSTDPVLGMGDQKQAEYDNQVNFFDQPKPNINDLYQQPQESTKAPAYDYKKLNQTPILKKVYKERINNPENKEPIYPLSVPEETESGSIVSKDIDPELQQQENEQKAAILNKINSGEINLPPFVQSLPIDEQLSYVGAIHQNNPLYTSLTTLVEPLLHLDNLMRSGVNKAFGTDFKMLTPPEMSGEDEDDKLITGGTELLTSLIPLGASLKGANYLLKGLKNPFVRKILSTGLGFVINSQPELLDNLNQNKIELKDYAIQSAKDFATGISFGALPPGTPLKYELPYQSIVPTMVPVIGDLINGKPINEKEIIDGLLTNAVLGLMTSGHLPKETPVNEVKRKIQSELNKYDESQQTPELVNKVIAGLLMPPKENNSKEISIIKPGEKKEAIGPETQSGEKPQYQAVKPELEKVSIPGDKSRIEVDPEGKAKVIPEREAEDMIGSIKLTEEQVKALREGGLDDSEIKAAQDNINRTVKAKQETPVMRVEKAEGENKSVSLPEETKQPVKDTSEPESKPKEKKEYSSTQVNIPKEEAKQFIDYGKQIPEKELYTEEENHGREDEPHITTLYGLHTGDPRQVENIVKGIGDKEVTLGKTSLFENDKFDVLKVDVDSPGLHEINKALRDKVKYTNSYDDYQPHLTIAYLKKGEGKKYEGDTRFEGKKIKVSELLFSSKDRSKTPITLTEESNKKDTPAEDLDPQEILGLTKSLENNPRLNDKRRYELWEKVPEDLKKGKSRYDFTTPQLEEMSQASPKMELMKGPTSEPTITQRNIFEKMTQGQLESHINSRVKEFGSRVDYLQSPEYKEIIKPLQDKHFALSKQRIRKEVEGLKDKLKNKIISRESYKKAIDEIKARGKNNSVERKEGNNYVSENKTRQYDKQDQSKLVRSTLQSTAANERAFEKQRVNERTSRSSNNRSPLKALRFTRELINKKRIEFRGQEVNSSSDLATLTQILRDPRYETFRVFYVTEGKVSAVDSITSRLPGSSTVFLKNPDRGIYDMKQKIGKLNADSVYLLHNHPSGDPLISRADLEVSKQLMQAIPQVKAHVIINSNKYSNISREDAFSRERYNPYYHVHHLDGLYDPLLTAEKDHDLLGRSITSDQELIMTAKDLRDRQEDHIAVFYVDKDLTIRAIEEIHKNQLKNYDNILGYLRNRATEYGSEEVTLSSKGVLEPELLTNVTRLFDEFYIDDYVNINENKTMNSIRDRDPEYPRLFEKNFNKGYRVQESQMALKEKDGDPESYPVYAERIAKKYGKVPTREEYNDAREYYKSSKKVAEKEITSKEKPAAENMKSELESVINDMGKEKKPDKTFQEMRSRTSKLKKKVTGTEAYMDKVNEVIDATIKEYEKKGLSGQTLLSRADIESSKQIYSDPEFKRFRSDQKKNIVGLIKKYFREEYKKQNNPNKSSYSYAGDAWYKQIMKKGFHQSLNVVRKMGEHGKKFADKMEQAKDDERMWHGKADAILFDITSLKKAELNNLEAVWKAKMYEKVPPMYLNDNVKEMDSKINKYFDDTAAELKDRAVMTRNKLTGDIYLFKPRKDYRPRVMKSDYAMEELGIKYDKQGLIIHNKERARVIEHLVTTGQAKDGARAAELLDGVIAESRVKKAGNVENSRTITLPDDYYTSNPVESLHKYATAVSKRLAFIDAWGKDGNEANSLIDEMGKAGQDYEFAKKLFKYETDQLTPQERKTLKNVNSVKGFQALTKFSPFTTLRNTFQGFLGATTRGNLKSGFVGLAKSLSPTMRRYIYESGAVADNIESLIKDIAGGSSDSKLGKMTSFYLDKIGFTMTDRANRLISGAAGLSFYTDMLKRIKNNSVLKKRALREFEKLGIDPEEILKRDNQEFTDAEKKTFIRNFAYDSQFSLRPQDLPLFWSSGTGKLLTQWKPWSYKMTQLIRDNVVGEIKKGNPMPLITMMAAYGLAGETASFIIDSIRSPFKYDAKKDDDEKLSPFEKTAFAKLSRGEIDGFMDRLLEDLGSLGALSAYYDFARAISYGKSLKGVGAYTGPAFGELITSIVGVATPLSGLVFGGNLFRSETEDVKKVVKETLQGVYDTAGRNLPGGGTPRTLGLTKKGHDWLFKKGGDSVKDQYYETLDDAGKEELNKIDDMEKALGDIRKKTLENPSKELQSEFQNKEKELKRFKDRSRVWYGYSKIKSTKEKEDNKKLGK